jgi:hypothetical protein
VFADEMEEKSMVITTFTRCQTEYRRKVVAGRMEGIGRKRRRVEAGGSEMMMGCPLLQMRRLRFEGFGKGIIRVLRLDSLS